MLNQAQKRCLPACSRACGRRTANAGGVCGRCLKKLAAGPRVVRVEKVSGRAAPARIPSVHRMPHTHGQNCGGGLRRVYKKLGDD